MAYPVTMVHLGVPVIKIRALREEVSNLNGFPSLLRLIAKRNPALWQLLARDSMQGRLWQRSQQLALVLAPKQLSQLEQWLAWIEVCPHPNCNIILFLSEQLISMSAHHWWQYRSEIEKGKLQIVPLEDLDQALTPRLAAMAASASVCDWLVLANDDLFYHPAKLLAQMRRAMLYPLSERVNGSPVLFRRHPLMIQSAIAI